MKNCPLDWYLRWWQEVYPTWEPQTFAIFDKFLDQRHVYLDVGAWIGPTVLYAASHARHVYCLEPDPEAFRVLQLNLAANPHYHNITALNLALSDEDGESLFGGNGELGNSESTLLVREKGYGDRRGELLRTANDEEEAKWRSAPVTRVQTKTIRALQTLYPLHECNFVKIDIEGGEEIVIPAIAGFLREHRPTLSLSLHWGYLTEPRILSVFRSLAAVYSHIYDGALETCVNEERLIRERISSIVCTAAAIGTSRV